MIQMQKMSVQKVDSPLKFRALTVWVWYNLNLIENKIELNAYRIYTVVYDKRNSLKRQTYK